MKKLLAILAGLILATNAFASTTYYSDGSSANRIGNTVYFSDGSTASQIGNTTYYSDGTSAMTF